MKSFGSAFLVLVVLLIAGVIDTRVGAQHEEPRIVLQLGHAGQINSIAFSPDSKLLASGGEDGMVKVWDAATGDLIRTFPGHSGVSKVVFDCNGRTLAIAGSNRPTQLWDVETGVVRQTLTSQLYLINDVAFSPNGKLLAEAAAGPGANGDVVVLWDAQHGVEVGRLVGHTSTVLTVAYSPDGKMIASADKDKMLRLWDAADRQQLRAIPVVAGTPEVLAFSPDGNTLAMSESGDTARGMISLWNPRTGQLLRSFKAEYIANSLSFSPDGKALAAGESLRAEVWEVATGTKLKTFGAFSQVANSVAFSPDGRVLAVAGGGVQFIDVATGVNQRGFYGHREPVNSVAFTPDDRSVVVGTGVGQVSLWDLAQGRMMKKYQAGKWDATLFRSYLPIEHVLSPNGRVLVARSKDQQSVDLFDALTGSPLRSLPGDRPVATSFSSDGKLIAAAHSSGDSRKIEIWETDTGKTLRSFAAPPSISNLCFSPDGRILAGSTGSFKDNIRLWDTNSGKELPAFTAHSFMFASTVFAFSPDGKALALSGGINQVKLFDTLTRKELRTLETSGDSPRAFAYNHRGNILAGAFGKSVVAWNIETGQIIFKLEGHDAEVNAIAFSHDDRVLVTGSSDSRVMLWDAVTGTKLVELVALADQNWLALAPDGRYDGTPESLQWMRVVRGTLSGPLKSFTASPFVPRLLSQVLYQRLSAIKEKPTIAPDAIAIAPSVKIQSPESGLVTETDDVEVSVVVTDRGTGIRQVQLFQNGRKIAAQTRNAERDTAGADSLMKFGVQLVPGINELRAVASNLYGKESEGVSVRIEHRIETAKLLNPTLVVQTGHNVPILAVAFNGNGSMLASASADNTIVLWDTATGKQVRSLGGAWETAHSIHFSLAFGTNGKELCSWAIIPVIGGARETPRLNEIKVWDLVSGRELRTSIETDERVETIPETKWFKSGPTVSPNGKIAAGTFRNSISLSLSGGQSRLLTGHSGVVKTVSFSPDSSVLASGSEDNTIRLWDTVTGRTLRTLAGHASAVNALAFAPHGRTLASGGKDATVILWDVSTGREIAVLKSRAGRVNSVVFSPDGAWLYESRRSGVNRFEVASGRLLKSFAPPTDDDTIDLSVLSPGGDVLAMGSVNLTLLDTRSGKTLQTLPGTWNEQFGPVAFSPDGKLLADVGITTVSVWDVAKGTVRYKLTGAHRDWVMAVAFSPDSEMLASAGGSEGETGEKIDSILLDNRTAVDNRILIFDVRSGRQTLEMAGHKDGVTELAWHPSDKKILASAGRDGAVRLWNTSNGKQLRVVGQFQSMVLALAWSHDGNLLAAADRKGTVKLWDVVSERELHSIKAHALSITGVAFSPNGKLLATSASDAMTKLWDVGRGVELAVISVVDGSEFLAFTPEGFYTASRGALHGVAFRYGNRATPIEQVDLKFNRPDKVAEKLGSSPEVIENYRRAYLKRLQRLAVSSEAIKDTAQFPDVTITDTDLPVSTDVERLTFHVRATDADTTLDRLHVFVNGSPLYRSSGLSLKERNIQSLEQPVTVQLSRGANRVEVSALNSRGVASLTRFFNVLYAAPPAKPELYIVAVGVSRYADSKRDLTYAAKDASDVAAYFEGRRDLYARVNTLLLPDHKATRENILKAREFLINSQVDDEVVIFFAGHGLLDSNLDYYFGTHDIDFKNPSGRGLAFEALEGLLDGVPARHKLLLIDTCHSGEVDKEELRVLKAPTASTPVKVRSLPRADILGIQALPSNYSIEMQQELFADLRRGSGAFVIAAAGGAEYAYEDSEWRNGVFTFALLEALRTGRADIDGDGQVSVSELRDYVSKRVRDLTEGEQKPTARKDNAEFDYAVVARPGLKLNLRHPGQFQSVAFSPDGKIILSSASDGVARLWDAVTGEQLRVITSSTVSRALFSPDGKLIVTEDDNRLRFWNTATGAEKVSAADGLLATPSTNSADFQISTFALSPTGKRIVTGGRDGTNRMLKMWDAVSGQEVRILAAPLRPESITFSPDGNWLVAVAAESNNDNTYVMIWDADTGKQLFALKQETGALVQLAFTPNSKTLAVTVSNDGSTNTVNKLKFINPATGKVVHEVVGSTQGGYFSSVVFSPDGRTLATGTLDGKLHLWDYTARQLLKTIEAHSEWISSVVFSPDGKLIATASWDGSVRLWNSKE